MNTNEAYINVCGKPLERFLREIESFHGWLEPGLVMGGFMLDLGRDMISPVKDYAIIAETLRLLPDVVQAFTSCTIGNGRLKIYNWDKFALSLFGLQSGCGFRVWLDPDKVKYHPAIYEWHMRGNYQNPVPLKVLIDAIVFANRSILSTRAIKMTHSFSRKHSDFVTVCPECGEAYPLNQGLQCVSCQGKSYYAHRFPTSA